MSLTLGNLREEGNYLPDTQTKAEVDALDDQHPNAPYLHPGRKKDLSINE